MAALTPSQIRAVNAFVDTTVLKAQSGVSLNYEAFTQRVSQAQGKGYYAAMNDVSPIMKKSQGVLGGGYSLADVASVVYELNSERFGSGLKIAADDIADDRYGIYGPAAELLGRRMAQFPQLGAYELLKEGDQTTLNGRSILSVDGTAFFADTKYLNLRDASGGTYDNKLALALNTTNFKTVYAALAARTDQFAKPMGLQPNTLIVPPTLMTVAAEVVYSPTVAAGGWNIYGNEMLGKFGLSPIQIIVAPELEGDAAIWYLAAVEGSQKPIIFQETEPLHLETKLSESDDNRFFDDELIWLVKGRCQFGFGDPRRIIRSEG
jgi:phage major head subunit gpT-like protein